MQAKDVMTTVATIGADATVKYAATLMIQRGISTLPVLDGKDRVIGVVSEGDLMRRTGLKTDVPRAWWLRVLSQDNYVKPHGISVRDVVTSPAISVGRSTPLHEVACLLERHRIKRVPVLGAGKLVGIVSRADLVRRVASVPARLPAKASGHRAPRRKVLRTFDTKSD